MAQVQEKDTTQANLSFAKKELIPLIEARMQQPGGDTARYFILETVRTHCNGDYDCLQLAYDVVLKRLEQVFKHFAGLLVAEEMATIAASHKDFNAQASAYKRLASLYAFLGDGKNEGFYNEETLRMYEKAGNTQMVIERKAFQLEGRAWHLGEVDEAISAIEEQLALALELGYNDVASRIRIRLKYLFESFGYYDKMVEQVEALEELHYSDPLLPSEAGFAFEAAKGRGDILLGLKKYGHARQSYLKALRILSSGEKSHHATWREIQTLHQLAKLEWELKDAEGAETFLDKADSIASKFYMHDNIIASLELRVTIAEAENDYEAAFRFTNKMMEHKATMDQAKGEHDSQRNALREQRDNLEKERERQELSLQLRSNQLNFSIAIVALVVLAAIGLFIGFRNQRRRKEELAAQNTLIQRQAEQLKALDAAKSRFFANVSHELRTPISLIRGPIHSVLKKKHLDEEDAQLLQLADQGSKDLQLLVNEILDLGKMESGRMELVPTPVRLSAYFTHYLSQFESLAYQKGVHYGFEVFLSKNTAGKLDKEKCRQLVYNLLSNAFKFTQTGGVVNVAVKMEGGQLQIEVRDTGKGIHPDDLPHVFDRYFQTNRPDAPATGGTGIGLALCQEYARLFGGQISVASEWGKGTVFKVAFPVEEVKGEILEEDLSNELISTFKEVKEKPDQFQAAPTAPPATGKKPTILVVEDNKELQSYMQLVLKKHFNVALAGNGHEALTHLAENGHPDLIISDLMMPIMDGYQLLERLKGEAASQHIPVIMLTARAEKDDRLKALRIGVDDYLTKPFDEEELIARITNLLSNKAVRTEVLAEEDRESGPVSIGLSERDKEWLDTFETYLRSHLSNNYLSVADMADEFAMSTSTLLRQTKRLTGLTPQQYLLEMRLDMARQLLEDRRYRSVSRVALEVGYGDARNFSKSYKKRFGKSPSELIVE
jgi:signal transduction histidine kinase/DNA-binding NarL/FixJ family response regulator